MVEGFEKDEVGWIEKSKLFSENHIFYLLQ